MPQVAQGGTIRLYATFRDSAGALADPITPLVDMLDPIGGVIVNDAVPVHESLGLYHYDFAPSISAALGDWTVRWTGTVDAGLIEAEESVEVVPPGSISLDDPADLITLAEYKQALGLTGTADDAKISAAIPRASQAIRNYTQRSLGHTPVTETRTYEYDGSGVIEIDDATAVTAVSFQGSLLDPAAYLLEPAPGPIYTWITLLWPRPGLRLISPEMGFAYNLDTLWPFYTTPPVASVTATFGWDVIPQDIKQAAIWTVEAWQTERPGNDIQGESIAAYSVQYAFAQTGIDNDAIPARAQSLLDQYRREVII